MSDSLKNAVQIASMASVSMRVAQLAVTLKETMADIHTKKGSWRQNTIPTMRSNVMCVTSGKRKGTTMEASNVKAMREALEHVEKLAREFAAGNYYVSDFPKMLIDAIRQALAAPARNCDAFSKAEVLEMLDGCSFSKEDTIEWLYAAKGEGDGGQ